MATLHDLMQAASTNVPRYLFRAWSTKSGGDARCNTHNAITPAYFLPGSTDNFEPNGKSASITDFSADELKTLYQPHYLSKVSQLTPFSSWAPSWGYALGYANDRLSQGDMVDEIYISCLDVGALRSLPDGEGDGDKNLVFFTGDPALHAATGVGGGHEFMIFGPIPGSTYATVSLQELEERSLLIRQEGFDVGDDSTSWRTAWHRTDSEGEALESGSKLACSIARAFNLMNFELAVACHVLAACPALKDADIFWMHNASKILRGQFAVPENWKGEGYGWYANLGIEKLCAAQSAISAAIMTKKLAPEVGLAMELLRLVEGEVRK